MKNAIAIIEAILQDITNPDGSAAVDRFYTLRDVDRKVSELRVVLGTLPDSALPLKEALNNDVNLSENSRRVRLESLAHHCKMVLRFIKEGVISAKKTVVKGPSFVNLTKNNPKLEDIIQGRWLEAQRCQHAGCFLSSVILMGSILEALLLAKALQNQKAANQSHRAPKRKDGSLINISEWTLNGLIEVAVDCGWLKVDRAKFSHALRESRNVVHPWQHAALGADFDEGTCRTCWEVLNASVDDLLR